MESVEAEHRGEEEKYCFYLTSSLLLGRRGIWRFEPMHVKAGEGHWWLVDRMAHHLL